jgi:hypothetical protein
MGLIIEYYSGNEEKIIEAVRKGDVSLFDGASYVIKKADFSFHLDLYEDLDLLVKIICQHTQRPSKKYETLIGEACFLDPEKDPECALYRMSHEFRNLIADIPTDSAKEIASEWEAKLAEKHPVNTSKNGRMKRIERKIEDIIIYCIFAPVFFIALAVVWIVSPKFRKESSENKIKLEEKKKNNLIRKEEYRLENAVADLIYLCQYAKTNNQNVLFFWCL